MKRAKRESDIKLMRENEAEKKREKRGGKREREKRGSKREIED